MMFTVHTTNYCGFTPVAVFLLLLRGWKPTLDICDDTRCGHHQSGLAPELVFFWQVIGKCPFGRDSQVSPEVDASKTPKIYDRTFEKYIKIRLWMS